MTKITSTEQYHALNGRIKCAKEFVQRWQPLSQLVYTLASKPLFDDELRYCKEHPLLKNSWYYHDLKTCKKRDLPMLFAHLAELEQEYVDEVEPALTAWLTNVESQLASDNAQEEVAE